MASGGRGHNSARFRRGQQHGRCNMVNVSCINANAVTFQGNIILLNTPFRLLTRPCSDNVRDEALRDPEPPKDLTPEFRPEDLEREVQEKFFIPVARAFDEDRGCRWLARKLKIDPPTMSKLNMWHRNNLPELVYQVMVAWKRINPGMKVRDLVKALCESRNQPQALVLKSYLEENYSSGENP